MDKKYITFYKKFILQTKTLSDGRVEQSQHLVRGNHARIGGNCFHVWKCREVLERVEKITNTLKEKGVLEEHYRRE